MASGGRWAAMGGRLAGGRRAVGGLAPSKAVGGRVVAGGGAGRRRRAAAQEGGGGWRCVGPGGGRWRCGRWAREAAVGACV
ncbi:hypothetical protein GUJ93_ZPchr0001g32689 [Zizania palustris]|uniref:Uncharacterized protein n=1 Tax=Zizania palustris TaxID=103762 RepID=A0A8J5VLR3_ZIZPA|nr:hypothetical protein GUJ93_ZPchr0001g32689 [Zizania palustris]